MRVPLGLKSSPSSVTQRVLTSLWNASDFAVTASCRTLIKCQGLLFLESPSCSVPSLLLILQASAGIEVISLQRYAAHPHLLLERQRLGRGRVLQC